MNHGFRGWARINSGFCSYPRPSAKSVVQLSLRLVFRQFIREHLHDLSGGFQSFAGDGADGLEMESILQAGAPVTVLFALFAGGDQVGDSFALEGHLDGRDDQSGEAEVVEVERVGQQFGFVDDGSSVRDFVQQAGGVVEKFFVDVGADKADEQFGRLLSAIAQTRCARVCRRSFRRSVGRGAGGRSKPAPCLRGRRRGRSNSWRRIFAAVPKPDGILSQTGAERPIVVEGA